MKRRRADLAHLDSYSQEYKTLHWRIKRGSVSWDEYVANCRERAANRPTPICFIEGCGKTVKAKGLCNCHYWRLMRNGDPLKLVKPRASVWWK